MIGFVVGVVVCAAVVWLLPVIRREMQDSAREGRFLELQKLTRETLPPEQLAALTQELAVIKTAQQMALNQGATLKQAYQMGQEAAIRSMANHLELNRNMPG